MPRWPICAHSGAAVNDALISCFRSKYRYSVVRPWLSVSRVMSRETWSSLPRYAGASRVRIARRAFGRRRVISCRRFSGTAEPSPITTYDYLVVRPNYGSFQSIAAEAGISRLYAGSTLPRQHCNGTRAEAVAANILSGKNKSIIHL